MKRGLYIFLVRSIVNIGGAEIYTKNKLNDLKEKDYDVLIFSTKLGTCYINELKPFYNFIFQELANDPFLYTINQRKKIINLVLKKIGNISSYDNVIIESQTVQLSVWGELLAQILNGTNFCFFADDRFAQLFSGTYDFLKFKLKRQELVGISSQSLGLLFKDNYEISDKEKYSLRFFCSNSIEDYEKSLCNISKLEHIEKYDIVLGSITRLEKICTPFIMNGILDFAKENPDKEILFIFFGGSENNKLEKFYKKKMAKQKNLNFILTGMMYPIPLQLVKLVNLFISVAGAAAATTREGIPTVVIELETGKPLGIFKYNTDSSQYKDNTNGYFSLNVKTILNEIFIEKKYCLDDIKKSINIDKYIIDFSSHYDFMFNSKNTYNIQYYDFSHYSISKKWNYLISSIYALFGGNNLSLLMNIYRTLKRK